MASPTIPGAYFATGGHHARDLAAVRIQAGTSADLLAGGPIDAPDYLAAGGHNSTEARGWRGQAIAGPSLTRRD